MAKWVRQAMKLEQRTRSELVREALRTYFHTRFPLFEATPAEIAAIRRGRAQIKRGNYVTLEQLVHDLAAPRRKPGSKRA